MKRRQAIQTMIAAPAVAALPLPSAAQEQRGIDEHPKLGVTNADAVSHGVASTFSPDQFAALRKLCETILPAGETAPGAIDAGVPEFMDFLIGASPADRITLYRNGLDRLNTEARRLGAGSFAVLATEQASSVLAPLRETWTYHGPEDALARFLVAAKQDIIAATLNSREWAEAMSKRSRSAGGLNTYWHPID